MKQIKVISDTHNHHDSLSDLDCDILIHCGDYGTKGNYKEGEKFLEWFVKQPAKYKILVPGNHDNRIKEKPELRDKASEYGIHVLFNEGLEIDDIKFWGGTYVPWMKWGNNQGCPIAQNAAWTRMPNDIDILITHVPPYGILDMNQEGYPCGCDKLLEKVKEVKPKIHLFGHIHEDGGKAVEKFGIIFYNCAVKDRAYRTVRNYREIWFD